MGYKKNLTINYNNIMQHNVRNSLIDEIVFNMLIWLLLKVSVMTYKKLKATAIELFRIVRHLVPVYASF